MDKEKYFIGLSLGFNSSACLMSNQRGLLVAISQERLNGVKNTKELPLEAMIECCKKAQVYEIENVSYSHYQVLTMDEVNRTMSKEMSSRILHPIAKCSFGGMIKDVLSTEGIRLTKGCHVNRVEHHEAHTLAVYGVYGTQCDSHYVITSDGFGDGYSGRISEVTSKGTKILSQVDMTSSVALIYQFTTGAMGYKEHQHEGKITGLAAFGAPAYVKDFEELFTTDDDYANGNGLRFDFSKCKILSQEEYETAKLSKIKDFEKFLMMKAKTYDMVQNLIAKGVEGKDIACSVQKWAEKVTVNWIWQVIKSEKSFPAERRDCFLSGGLFANVRINQKINDSDIFKNVNVCPSMGDEGTCIGAAIKTMGKPMCSYVRHADEISGMKAVACGTETKNKSIEDIIRVLDENDIAHLNLSDEFLDVQGVQVMISKYDDDEDLIDCIADDLSKKRIVCLVRGKMEFGPRALCRRSILYDCTQKSTNDWLNKQLGRTEFMPFAPVCLEEDADDLFYNLDGGRQSAKYMTMTFDCQKEFRENYPAALHIDWTARPQIVNEGESEFMYDLLKKYKEKTGMKVLINTSFNLHNNPIIESTKVAIESWLKSNTDILVIDKIVLRRVK